MSPRARSGSATTTPADPAEHAREIALRLLTHSARSSAQLREGLVSRDVDPEVADEVIARYREVGLLDDAALSASIVRTRHRERGRSRRAIEQELRRKGFEAGHIEDALDQISSDDERDAARILAAKRWESLEGLEDQVKVRRVVGMLGRRGYGPSLAYGLVQELQRADRSGT
ncbi:regulatory protein RecX [uncultured Demequina sp.]|uniref:regulatory protein RecX n=1 Tax=uncultured Demequina sp. TaxID=693499 RepID=UPI0025F600B2|nr:regulatory protein RecX [uncultured Demequina sp.]